MYECVQIVQISKSIFNIKKYFSENPTKMFASDINLSYTVT